MALEILYGIHGKEILRNNSLIIYQGFDLLDQWVTGLWEFFDRETPLELSSFHARIVPTASIFGFVQQFYCVLLYLFLGNHMYLLPI